MRRIRSTTGRLTLFLAMFAVAMLVYLPLRLVLGWIGLGDQGLTARSVAGTFWAGSLYEARLGEVALGDLRAGVSPVQLLVGRARIDMAARETSPETRLAGAVSLTRHSSGVDDMTATIPVGRVFAPLPIAALDLDDVSVRFLDGACEQAEGRVRATLAGDVAGVTVSQAMGGTARCDAGALLLPLTGQAGTDGATLRLWKDGRYRAELTIAPGDAATAVSLERSGFVRDSRGYRLSVEGRF